MYSTEICIQFFQVQSNCSIRQCKKSFRVNGFIHIQKVTPAIKSVVSSVSVVSFCQFSQGFVCEAPLFPFRSVVADVVPFLCGTLDSLCSGLLVCISVSLLSSLVELSLINMYSLS